MMLAGFVTSPSFLYLFHVALMAVLIQSCRLRAGEVRPLSGRQFLLGPSEVYGQIVPETLHTGMIRSLTTLYPDTRREHHPTAPHVCELPPRQRPRRLPRPLPRRPRTHFLTLATRPHSPNPHLRRWTIPASLPIARPTALLVPPERMPPYPRFGFSPEPVS